MVEKMCQVYSMSKIALFLFEDASGFLKRQNWLPILHHLLCFQNRCMKLSEKQNFSENTTDFTWGVISKQGCKIFFENSKGGVVISNMCQIIVLRCLFCKFFAEFYEKNIFRPFFVRNLLEKWLLSCRWDKWLKD